MARMTFDDALCRHGHLDVFSERDGIRAHPWQLLALCGWQAWTREDDQ